MEVRRHQVMTENEHVTVGSNLCEKCETKYLGSLLTNQNFIHKEMKCRLKSGNSC